jgi:hypothetical protein
MSELPLKSKMGAVETTPKSLEIAQPRLFGLGWVPHKAKKLKKRKKAKMGVTRWPKGWLEPPLYLFFIFSKCFFFFEYF